MSWANESGVVPSGFICDVQRVEVSGVERHRFVALVPVISQEASRALASNKGLGSAMYAIGVLSSSHALVFRRRALSYE
jgi:hypothetical protein